ncbi:MAG: lipopolysaccharide biosynthesis protein [Saprospiraceae bacterium]
MSLLKKLAGETAIYGISSILSRLLNWVVLTPYFTRIFAPQEYGVVSELYAWIALLLILFTYRMETAFFRFGRKPEELTRTFSTASISLLISTFVFTGILLLLAQPIATWLKYPDHPDYLIWFLLIVALDALAAIPFARLRLQNRPMRFMLLKTLGIIVNIIFVFFFFEACPWLIQQGWTWISSIYDAENRLAYVFIANFVASLITLLLLLPYYFKIKLEFDRSLLNKMVWYALPLVLSGVAGIVNQFIGIPLLKELASNDLAYNKAQMGIFGAASKIAVLLNLFTQAFNYAAEPFFFRHADRDDSKIIYAQVAQAFAIVGSIAILGILLYMDIIQYFIGAAYREGLGIVPILLIANLFLGLYYSVSIWFKLADRTRVGGWISLVGSIITILVNLIFIPVLGYYAPAWAALACYGFMLAACWALGQKYYPIDYPVGRILLYVGLIILFYLVSIYTRTIINDALWLVLFTNTGLFLLFVFILYRIERKGLLQALRTSKS